MKLHDISPRLEDYTAFHGMLCKPDVARRCIKTFKDGAGLFASQVDYNDALSGSKKIANFDFNNSPLPLNTMTYYLLVIMSLTGFCSLFLCTKVLVATECIERFDANSKDVPGNAELRFKKGDGRYFESSSTSTNTPLRLPPEALEYVIDRSAALGPLHANTEIKDQTNDNKAVLDAMTLPELILIRRFEYDFGGVLSVMMLHFVCTNGRTHLVEIFRFKRTITGLLATILIQPLYIAKALLQNVRSRRQPVSNNKKTI